MKYSIKKGLLKGIQAILVTAIAVISVTQYAELDIWSLLETYLGPVLGGLNVVGALTIILNYIKVKNSQ